MTEARGEILNSAPCKQPNQLVHWFFTWNNYPQNWLEILEPCFKRLCKTYTMQPEIGASGTHHIQGCISLLKKARWSEFDLPKSIHWEPTHNSFAAKNYCKKLETRLADFSYEYVKPKVVIRDLITELRPWQKKVFDLLMGPVDQRKAFWFWEPIGNVGKSAFVKYMCWHHKALFCCGGKFADLVNLIYNNDMEVCNMIIFDIPRNHGGRISYDTLECIKNGMVCNTKYETGTLIFNKPHLVIFANSPPENLDALSEDKWHIREIKDGDINMD